MLSNLNLQAMAALVKEESTFIWDMAKEQPLTRVRQWP